MECTVNSLRAPGTPRSTRQHPKLDKIGNPAGRAAGPREPRTNIQYNSAKGSAQAFFFDLAKMGVS